MPPFKQIAPVSLLETRRHPSGLIDCESSKHSEKNLLSELKARGKRKILQVKLLYFVVMSVLVHLIHKDSILMISNVFKYCGYHPLFHWNCCLLLVWLQTSLWHQGFISTSVFLFLFMSLVKKPIHFLQGSCSEVVQNSEFLFNPPFPPQKKRKKRVLILNAK